MSRSFRRTDADQFTAKREAFAERKAVRDERRAAFASLGYEDADALADRPMVTGRRADRTREAFRAGR